MISIIIFLRLIFCFLLPLLNWIFIRLFQPKIWKSFIDNLHLKACMIIYYSYLFSLCFYLLPSKNYFLIKFIFFIFYSFFNFNICIPIFLNKISKEYFFFVYFARKLFLCVLLHLRYLVATFFTYWKIVLNGLETFIRMSIFLVFVYKISIHRRWTQFFLLLIINLIHI